MGDELSVSDAIFMGFAVILIFVLLCRCSKYSEYFNSNTNYKMVDKDVGLYYGSTPMRLGSPYGLNYIRVNANNEIEIPNSKTALRRLMDEGSYECKKLDTDHDASHSNHLLQRQSIDDIVNLKKIQAQTRSRNNIVPSQ